MIYWHNYIYMNTNYLSAVETPTIRIFQDITRYIFSDDPSDITLFRWTHSYQSAVVRPPHLEDPETSKKIYICKKTDLLT